MSVSSVALADGHRHPSPVRVGAVHRRLDERRVDDRLRHPLGLGDDRGRRRRRPRSASRRPHRRGRSASPATPQRRRAPPRARRHRPAPAAPLASTTAVSLVDVSVSMLTQLNVRSTTRRNRSSSSALVDGGIRQQHGDHRRHVGLDHPDALGDADDPSRTAADRRRRPPWAPCRSSSSPAPPPRHRCRAGATARRRRRSRIRCSGIAPPDHARRSDQHVRRRAAEPLTPPRRRRPRRPPRPSGAGRDVGVLRHDDDRLRPAVVQVLAADRRRSGRRTGCA